MRTSAVGVGTEVYDTSFGQKRTRELGRKTGRRIIFGQLYGQPQIVHTLEKRHRGDLQYAKCSSHYILGCFHSFTVLVPFFVIPGIQISYPNFQISLNGYSLTWCNRPDYTSGRIIPGYIIA